MHEKLTDNREHLTEPVPVQGIRYYVFPPGGEVTGRDGKVSIPCGDLPVPLLEEEWQEADPPSYDAVGRGIYQLLRTDPDVPYAARYAGILRDGYPHIVSEMASHLLMMERKEMDVAYLDRKIASLKVFSLMEPENGRLSLEIGSAYLEKGLSIQLLHLATSSLYQAEKHLRKGEELSPDDRTIRYHLGEVSYILGRYDHVPRYWSDLASRLEGEASERIRERLRRVEAGILPRVPAVDYLEAAGEAFALYHRGEYEDAAGILLDILDDPVFCEEFPMPELFYVLGLCCSRLGMPRYAGEYFREALQLNPDYREARSALDNLYT